jgi:hypothetical protein
VAHLVAHLGALGRQFAAPRHCKKSSSIPKGSSLWQRGAGVQNHVHPGNRGRIGAERRGVKIFGCARFSAAPENALHQTFARIFDRKNRFPLFCGIGPLEPLEKPVLPTFPAALCII